MASPIVRAGRLPMPSDDRATATIVSLRSCPIEGFDPEYPARRFYPRVACSGARSVGSVWTNAYPALAVPRDTHRNP